MSKISEMFESGKTFAIISHINPDADAIASSICLKHWLEKNFDKKQVDIFLDGEISELYSPLTMFETINPIERPHYDIAIVLDCPNTERLGIYESIIKNSDTVMNIDHHETNANFGNCNIVAKKAASTGEILFSIFKTIKPIDDKKMAECIFHSIITDTSCFSSNTMSQKTYNILSEILKFGIDSKEIKNHYFNSISKSKHLLLQKALSSMQFYCHDRLSIMNISYGDFEETGAEFSDTLGIVQNGINIQGVNVAIIFIEQNPEEYYVSLRGQGINVGEIAKEFQGGGGASMAAFQYKGNDIELIKELIVNACQEKLQSLPNEEDDQIFYL